MGRSTPRKGAYGPNGKGRFNATRRRRDLDAAVAAADCVLLLTPHGGYDLERIADLAQVVFDTRNAYGSAHRPNVVTL